GRRHHCRRFRHAPVLCVVAARIPRSGRPLSLGALLPQHRFLVLPPDHPADVARGGRGKTARDRAQSASGRRGDRDRHHPRGDLCRPRPARPRHARTAARVAERGRARAGAGRRHGPWPDAARPLPEAAGTAATTARRRLAGDPPAGRVLAPSRARRARRARLARQRRDAGGAPQASGVGRFAIRLGAAARVGIRGSALRRARARSRDRRARVGDRRGAGGRATDVIAIVGPTASGKTALALRVAERLDAEVVSADSRLVYRGMDIGTAKPSREERARVRHHLVDVVEPGERYDVYRYQRDARAALDDIRGRGRVAILVGGTGLYVRAGLDRRLPSMTAHGYAHWAAHLRGEIDLETAVVRTARDVRAYSRRQMTWFRRDPEIRWFDPTREDPLALILEAAA